MIYCRTHSQWKSIKGQGLSKFTYSMEMKKILEIKMVCKRKKLLVEGIMKLLYYF
jgi:hypothetical protein